MNEHAAASDMTPSMSLHVRLKLVGQIWEESSLNL